MEPNETYVIDRLVWNGKIGNIRVELYTETRSLPSIIPKDKLDIKSNRKYFTAITRHDTLHLPPTIRSLHQAKVYIKSCMKAKKLSNNIKS